jgi:hypothetical protein
MSNVAAVKKVRKVKDPSAAPRARKPFKVRVIFGLKNAISAARRAAMIPALADSAIATGKMLTDLLTASLTAIPSDFAPAHDIGRPRSIPCSVGSRVRLKTEVYAPRMAAPVKLTQYDWILGAPAQSFVFTIDAMSPEHGMAVLHTDEGKSLTVKLSHIAEVV